MGNPSTSVQALNATTIAIFLGFVVASLAITWWAARNTRSKEDYFAAGRSISAWQNGLALAGDFMGAATLLGTVGLITLRGFDGITFAIGAFFGWPLLVFLIAEHLRRIGKYTVADVVANGLNEKPVRLAVTISTVVIIVAYLVGQLVGAGGLIALIFGLDYAWSVLSVTGLMLVYVLAGGMLATTWVQIVKAVLLVLTGVLLAGLAYARFGFNPFGAVTASIARYGQAVVEPGALFSNGYETASLGIGLLCGLLGMPHVLVRFYTVPDALAARKSTFYATCWFGFFLVLVFSLGYAALALVGREAVVAVDRGGNMATLLLARELGGQSLVGIVGAVTFATILAVVAGLVISLSSAVSHDLWNGLVRSGKATDREQITAARVTAILAAITAAFLAIMMKGQNVIFLTTLAFGIAAAANFPVLLLAIFWKRLTTAGVLASIAVGLITTLVAIWGSPTIQVDVFKLPENVWFPFRNPAIITVPLSFVVAVAVSVLTKKKIAAMPVAAVS
jgi:cation/acetate symporter